MVNGESRRFTGARTGDLHEKNGVVIVVRPGRNPPRVSAVVLEQIFYQVIQLAVFPRDENGGALIIRFCQLAFQTLDVAKAELRVDRQAAADGGRLNGRERADIIIAVCAIHFLGGIRRKEKTRQLEVKHQELKRCIFQPLQYP